MKLTKRNYLAYEYSDEIKNFFVKWINDNSVGINVGRVILPKKLAGKKVKLKVVVCDE